LDTDYKVNFNNVETPKNKFVYTLNQAEREDQVLCHISVQNKTSLQWGNSANSEGQSYVEILNKSIPSKAFEIKQSCQRIQARLKTEISRIKIKGRTGP
jgi:hypothetical protein